MILLYGSLALGLASFFFSLFGKSEPKTCFINYEQVYNAFEFKNDLEKQFVNIRDTKMGVLDSLKYIINLEASKAGVDRNKLNEMTENYYMIQDKINNEIDGIQNDFSNQIVTQLQVYVSDFAEENNYSYVFGANSAQNIVFGSLVLNKSNEVIEFINQRYREDNK